ncbi:ABC transporter permease subunit [Pseudarthrobacter psychrotolerans]|uniref:ABC transporter permease subunit n=1 Tax=Pseudarthrobacter psychrotolerans TaxID=2697569 RepID=A0A6P1NP02_9MICC|nr:ABC transporter permease [Pseudarthrobacter psychrotolerans]QHK22106.1 ABC transporter permease subunit [Pseudarthrobacter psychrotolerans]
MLTFLFRRAVTGVILIVAISIVTFVLIYASGGDIARHILGGDADQAQVDAKARELGLDQPIMNQYFAWFGKMASGDFGRSWFTSESVTAAVSSRLSVTLSIVVVALIVVAIMSVILGVTAAVRRGWVDRVVQIVSVLGVALPNFWLALMLVVILAINIPVFPATGYVAPATSVTGWMLSITLPVIAITVGGVAGAAQQIRGSVIDVMRQDYVRTLRSRGLSRSSVLFKHVLRNAAPAALTVLSLQFIGMIGGAVVIEKVFALPGLGLLALNATLRGDIPIVMAVVMTMAAVVVIVNLTIDLVNGWASPKARVK